MSINNWAWQRAEPCEVVREPISSTLIKHATISVEITYKEE